MGPASLFRLVKRDTQFIVMDFNVRLHESRTWVTIAVRDVPSVFVREISVLSFESVPPFLLELLGFDIVAEHLGPVVIDVPGHG